ncbi:MAG: 2-oxoacid:ferredoxin oxidoreductase subunit beta [Desulfobulbaceae bacterium]
MRHDKKFPHVWCPGCGNGIVMGSLLRAISGLGLSKDEVVLISGIGCSGRMPTYLDFNTLHTTHGRALTFATGVKLAKPSLTVMAIMGDGDATAIGGNHFIHAARRNLNLTAVIINNSIYGMTGGQYSPTTPFGALSTTSIYGHIEHAFSIAELAVTAGAAFVARTTVYHVDLMDRLLEQAIQKRGFAVLEIISNCHVQYGRRNRMGDAVDMISGFRDNSVSVRKAEAMSAEELEGRITIGVLADREMPVSTEEYAKVRQRAKEKGK